MTWAVAACGGGGSTGPGTSAPTPPRAFDRSATVPMSLSIPIRKPNAHVRRPRFVSPGLQSLALYDGNELIYVMNVDLAANGQFTTVYFAPGAATSVAPGSCTNNTTTETCTLTLTTTPGKHVFGLVAYPQQQSGSPAPPTTGGDPTSPVTLSGVISSEGEVTMNLSAGTNPASTLTMLGVAYTAYITSDSEEVELPYGTPTNFPYQILDSTFSQILQPGDYDNGPITFTATKPGVFTVSPTSLSTPPSAAGDQTLTVTCTAVNGDAATLLVSAKSKPNTNYASALAYSSANYSAGGVLTSLLISCDAQPPQ
ncbi:MAG TPA: hypothetical protein VHS78_10555 [Candidatus Elarobacter sp.]|jgi:hypothetical protein|nr:hypothetical protein [Candidatus Elarobacter sp.]